MIKITYICDKCGAETKPEDIFELLAMAPADGVSVPGDVMAELEDRHICRKCIAGLFPTEAEEKPEEKPAEKPAKKAKKSRGSTELDKKKAWYLSKSKEAQVIEMYKAGKEIEEISDELMVGFAPISRFIHDLGLGEERYKGQYIPSDGSAPVVQGVFM